MATVSTRVNGKLYTAPTMWEVVEQIKKDVKAGRLLRIGMPRRTKAKVKKQRNGWCAAVCLILLYITITAAGQALTN